jgi:hypothetical protein
MLLGFDGAAGVAGFGSTCKSGGAAGGVGGTIGVGADAPGLGGGTNGFGAGATACVAGFGSTCKAGGAAGGGGAAGLGGTIGGGMAGFGGATAATGFLAGALAITFLAAGLRAGDLAILAFLAGALAGADFAEVLLADFFAADFFVVFFAAATFFFPFVAFFTFFAMVVLPIAAADFPEAHRGNQTGLAQAVMELHDCPLNCGLCVARPGLSAPATIRAPCGSAAREAAARAPIEARRGLLLGHLTSLTATVGSNGEVLNFLAGFERRCKPTWFQSATRPGLCRIFGIAVLRRNRTIFAPTTG